MLRPIGLQQKGRSRLWFADQGWWVGIVEFQPHGWMKGSFLNVGATLLWSERESPGFTYDVGGRVDGLGRQVVAYEDDEQYAPEARALATYAVSQIDQLRSELTDGDAVARLLAKNGGLDGYWPGFQLGQALGFAGRHAEAAAQFRRLREITPDGPPYWTRALDQADELATLLETDPDAFHARQAKAIATYREALKLP